MKVHNLLRHGPDQLMGFTLLQWKARNLIVNGQEFKKYIDNLREKANEKMQTGKAFE